MIDLNDKKIIISRTDSIGDVMLTLPICAWLKEQFPTTEIIFLGKGYTRPIVEQYSAVDSFIDWNDFVDLSKPEQQDKFKAINADVIVHVFPNKEIAALAKKVKIKERVGTSHRTYHLLTCNQCLNFTRKSSDLHEAQLNYELLRPFGLKTLPTLEEVIEKTKLLAVPKVELPSEFKELKDYTILHPKSQGSAKEWPIEKYMSLAKELLKEGKTVVFTGTNGEGAQFRGHMPSHKNCIDTSGKFSLEQLMVFINNATNLVACSTGPLHLAGYYGVNAVGLFSPKRPIHPGRWKALGENVKTVVFDENCQPCKSGKDCFCIENITVESVKKDLI